jgi:hypothetical protein
MSASRVGKWDVDGRADDAGPAGDLGHAGVGIAREGVDGGAEDARDAALGAARRRGRPGPVVRRVGIRV